MVSTRTVTISIVFDLAEIVFTIGVVLRREGIKLLDLLEDDGLVYQR
jgi:hypothetical protein